MADLEYKVKVVFEIEPRDHAEVLLRQLIAEEMQAVLSLTASSSTLQESVRRIVREEIEQFKREQQQAVRARFGPQERKS